MVQKMKFLAAADPEAFKQMEENFAAEANESVDVMNPSTKENMSAHVHSGKQLWSVNIRK
jgi:hypothetical protein